MRLQERDVRPERAGRRRRLLIAARSAGAVTFDAGDVTSLRTQGYGNCTTREVAEQPYRSTTGAFRSLVQCGAAMAEPSASAELNWTLSYNY